MIRTNLCQHVRPTAVAVLGVIGTGEFRRHVRMGSCAKEHLLLMPIFPNNRDMTARRAQQARCSRYAGPRPPLGAWRARISRGALSRRGGLEASSYSPRRSLSLSRLLQCSSLSSLWPAAGPA